MRRTWLAKPAFAAVVAATARRIAAAIPGGPVLEIGAGAGHFKPHVPGAVASDVAFAPWLDLVADAHRLPFADHAFAALVLVDTLHHLAAPGTFFAEAARVLRPGGRLVLVEPAITPVSRLAFALAHPEPVDLDADPFAELAPAGREPCLGNQAIPHLILGRHRRRFEALFPELAIVEVRRFALFAYPLSGGFRRWSLVSGALVPALLRLEDVLAPVLGWLCAFRLFAVIERR